MNICEGDVLQFEKILLSQVSVYMAKLENHIEKNKVKEVKDKPAALPKPRKR